MKLIFAAAMIVIAATATATEDVKVPPLTIETIVPKMTSDNSVWRVKVTAGYIVKPGVNTRVDVMTFEIPSGDCRSGVTKIVPMSGFEAKVTQKLCAGQVDGQNVILGWMVADKVDQKPLSKIDSASLNYGERMYFRFNGTELTAEASIYTVEAKRL